MLGDIFKHAFDAGDGNGETDAVGAGAGGGIDANDFAGGVDEWPAGVAGVDGGVSLDHVGEGFGARAVTV